MSEQRYRVLAVATHPVQYMSPLFRRMSAHPAISLQVAYCTLRGALNGYDPEFGVQIQWDVPLLDGYDWLQVPNRGSGKESFFGLCNTALWNVIRTGNYAAVLCYVAYMRSTFWISYSAARASGTAFLFGTDAVTLDPLDRRMWKRSFKSVLWPFFFRIPSQVLVSSTPTQKLILSLGVPRERVTLTPSVVENDWWMEQSRQADRAAVRAFWGIPSGDTVFVFSGKLQPWKSPQDLLRAFAQAGLPNAHLVVAGEGPLRSQLEAEAAALGIASRVRFLGFVNQSRLPAVYTAADLMVLPSFHENFGFVVNEAMLCGCPVAVSSNVGAASDLVAPVSPDLVYPHGDLAALAKILRDAATDPPRLRVLAQASLAHIQKWSPERNITATVEAIRTAVTRTQRGRAGQERPK